MDTLSAMVIKLPEIFHAKQARKLRREIKKRITTCSTGIILDLSRVKNIDLRGLGALLDCMAKVARRDGALQLGGISPEAATLLELTRMDRLFQKFPGFSIEPANVTFCPEPELAAEAGTAKGDAASPMQLPVAV